MWKYLWDGIIDDHPGFHDILPQTEASKYLSLA